MSQPLALRLQMDPLRTLAFSSISDAYMSIGSAFSNPIRILLVQNLTDVTLTFSDDGINDKFQLPSNGFLLLDISSNKSVSNGFFISQGTTIYVIAEGSSPSLGSANVTAMYGAE